jgi:hypothetical protein
MNHDAEVPRAKLGTPKEAIVAQPPRHRKMATLASIQNSRIRNLMRGALNTNDHAVIRKAIGRLRQETSEEDAVAAFRFLHENPQARRIPRVVSFPKNAAEADRAPFFVPAPISIELIHQSIRLAYDADKLVGAIGLLGKINKSLLKGDTKATSALFARYRKDYGISLLVAMKAMSARHSAFASIEGAPDLGDVVAPFLSPRRQIIAVAFEDSIDTQRDYLGVRRTFMNFVEKGRLDGDDAAIIRDIFSPFNFEHDVLTQCIQAYGRWGLLDTVACLYRIRRVFEQAGEMEGVAAIDAVIPATVRQAWQETFASLDFAELQLFVGMGNQFFDRELFAHLPAWSEYEMAWDYRLRTEDAIGQRIDGAFPVTRKNAGAMAAPQKDVKSLLFGGVRRISLGSIDPVSSGGFHRTIALIASLEAGTLGDIDGEQLAVLLDQTVDVANFLSRDELKAFLPRRRSDPLYEFFRTALTHDQEEDSVSQHAFRRSLQELVQTGYGGNLVGLLEHVDSPDGHVSGYLYNKCSEAFLTELYDLFDETDLVTDAHANILEWRGTRSNDEQARLRARSHRLNLRLRKVRGAIEETRIYVDPLRFIAWIGEEKNADLRTLSLQADVILADKDRTINFGDPVRLAVTPRLKLLEVFDQCYEEFCTNKIYGVTSFIGRRIRHGTLHGHLVIEFRPEIEKAISDFRYSAPGFAEYLMNWIKRFDVAVQQMAADRIHVKSKDKQRGLIVATLNEPEKHSIAQRMVEDIATVMKERPQIAQSAALIHEHCWLLFEEDLKRTRDAVENLRRDFVINVEEHRCDRAEMDRRISDTIRALNTSLQQRFETVRSWFTRPTNQAPSASVSLLVSAVLNEVGQRFPGFKPRLDTRTNRLDTGTNQDVDLIGHRFHYFYDALYIFVVNVAQHGKRDGVLLVEINSSFADDKYMDLSVSIRSELASGKEGASKAKIDEAMRAEIGDAVLRNQNSGIGKLREMVADVEEIIGFRHRFEDNAVIFTIDTRYARS